MIGIWSNGRPFCSPTSPTKCRFSPCFFIRREAGPATYLPSNLHEINSYGGGDVMVWTGIMLDGPTPLHVFDRGGVTGVRYRDEVLEPYVCLFRGAVGPSSSYRMITRGHIELFCSTNFSREYIHQMDWPATSPDLKPLEVG
ncbi:hypothetical protein X975_09636, partial [Stegodyphus mimosarum]